VLGVLVGTDTVTAQGHSPRTGHARTGDFYPAKNGDLHLATSGDFFMATDTNPEPCAIPSDSKVNTGHSVLLKEPNAPLC
jgi:hypothetical protein